jgi:hypothetical protein
VEKRDKLFVRQDVVDQLQLLLDAVTISVVVSDQFQDRQHVSKIHLVKHKLESDLELGQVL